MLVDDDEDDNFFHEREIIDNHMAKTVVVKDSGRKALDYLKAKTDPLSELIFLDINMPGMTGWEFLNEYTMLEEELKERTVIVMLSTSANPKDIAKAKSWEFVSDYITKPLTKERLEIVIRKYFKAA